MKDFIELVFKILVTVGTFLFFILNLTFVQSSTFNATVDDVNLKISRIEKSQAIIETTVKNQSENIKEIKSDVKTLLRR